MIGKNIKNPVKQIARILFASGFLVFFCSIYTFSAFAKTPAEYLENIKTAQNLTNKLLDPSEEDLENPNYSEYRNETLTKIRENLSASEKIEFGGTVIETNNTELIEKLDELSKDSVTNSPESGKILSEVEERLAGIEQKLEELENAAAADRTKDEDKRKLAEILRREEFQKPTDEKSLFERMRDAVLDWIARLFPRPNVSSPSFEGLKPLSFILQILIYALVLGIIGFLIYRFAPYFLERFRKQDKKENTERVILGEKLRPDESSDDIFSEAEQLARQGNLREAIRKGYIAFLCELDERKIINLSRHKTNRDYLRDIRKRRELYQNMNGLTSNFERHWYGFENADENDWEEFKNGYKKAVSSQL